MKIDWDGKRSVILVNPKLPSKKVYQTKLETIDLQGHFWLATSGSTCPKWVALSKEAVMHSAFAVNQHIQSDKSDVWIHALPDFHIGGLAVWARAHVSGASVVDYKLHSQKWCPKAYCDFIASNEGTLTALVPTQVYDLVNCNLQAPHSLRALLVGGGRLAPNLYSRALNLGWKCLPTYGMSETASQVATALPESSTSDMILLPHVKAKIDKEGVIHLSSSSLLTCYAYVDNDIQITDPKEDGWLTTDDVGSLKGNVLKVRGRKRDFIKISGESVSLTILDGILDILKLELDVKADIALVPMPSERLGCEIHLATTHESLRILTLIEEFQKRVLPFEKIRHLHLVESIPRTAMDKLKRDELVAICMDASTRLT